MKLNFCGNSPQQKYFRIGVVGNNLVDDLVLSLDNRQGDILLSEFKPFIKIVNGDMSFADKTQNFTFITDDPDKVEIYYKFPDKVTKQYNVDMQLLFQKSVADDTIVWQSEAFNITFEMSLPVTDTIARDYPDVLQDLETRVGSLEGASVSLTECIDRNHFPPSGEANVIYLDVAEGMPYRFDTAAGKFIPIGLNADDIKIINANGGI